MVILTIYPAATFAEMTYSKALQAFNVLLLRCERIASASSEDPQLVAEESSQLVCWILTRFCYEIDDRTLAEILDAFREEKRFARSRSQSNLIPLRRRFEQD